MPIFKIKDERFEDKNRKDKRQKSNEKWKMKNEKNWRLCIVKITDHQGSMNIDKINRDFRERILNFSVDVIKFLNTMPYKKEYDVLRYQLSKAATSIGGNFQDKR